jgi:hypothetical protein
MALTECPLVRRVARPTDPRPVRSNPQVAARQRMSVFAVRLGRMMPEGHVLGVCDNREVIWIPTGMDTTPVMQLPAFWDWAPQEFPAESVRVAVLRLGDPPVRGG